MINQSLRVAALATAATLLVPLLGGTLAAVPAQAQGGDGSGLGPDVFPPLKRSLVAYYDFDHPVPGAPGKERDRGLSGTDIDLVNGGAPWRLEGPPEPDVSTASDPAGIKIGGSFPQNTLERNPCNCRMDTLLFLDRPATPAEIRHQHRR